MKTLLVNLFYRIISYPLPRIIIVRDFEKFRMAIIKSSYDEFNDFIERTEQPCNWVFDNDKQAYKAGCGHFCGVHAEADYMQVKTKELVSGFKYCPFCGNLMCILFKKL